MRTHLRGARRVTIAVAVLTLAQCACKTNKFPGYTYSGTANGTAIFYSVQSIRRLDDGNTVFGVLLQNPDKTYVIQTVVSDCANRFQARGGTLYSRDGTMLRNVATEVDLDKYNFPRIPQINKHPEMAVPLREVCKASAGLVPTQSPPINGDFSIPGALESLYGNYQAETGTATWKYLLVPYRPPFLFPDIQGVRFDTSAGTVRVIWDWPFWQHSVEKHFIVTATQPESEKEYDCHACPFLIGAFVFSKQQGRWSVESGEKYLTVGGAFGQVPKPHGVQIDPDHYQVLVDNVDAPGGSCAIVVNGRRISASPLTGSGR
jgi:hypothetical protein